MPGGCGEGVAQPGDEPVSVEAAGLHDAGQDAYPAGAFGGVAAVGVLAIHDHGSDLTFGAVVVGLDGGIAGEAHQVVDVLAHPGGERLGLDVAQEVDRLPYHFPPRPTSGTTGRTGSRPTPSTASRWTKPCASSSANRSVARGPRPPMCPPTPGASNAAPAKSYAA